MTKPRLARRRVLGMGVLTVGSTLVPTGGAHARSMPQIENVVVQTSVRKQNVKLSIDYTPNGSIPDAELVINITELNGDTTGLPSTRVPLEVTTGDDIHRQAVTMEWSQPRLWNVGAPYLYFADVRIVGAEGGTLEAYAPVRFGFREVWADGKDLILNGDPIKLRLAPFQLGVPQMIFYSGMGMNAMEFQPHVNFWTGNCPGCAGYFEGARQAGSPDLFDAADEHGWAILMPTPSVNPIASAFEAGDESVVNGWVDDFWGSAKEFDRQNRPSILAWCPSMNTANLNLDPERLGRHPANPPARWYGPVERVIKGEDPTRLVYHHQGGQTGDMEMPNFFLSLLPLQEREDFLSAWSADGDKPFGAAEHGLPYSANFFRQRLGHDRDGAPHFTEFCAAYLGDRAYSSETDTYIEQIADVAADPATVGEPDGTRFAQRQYLERIGETTAYFDYLDLFIRNTNKAYRGWGINAGMFPWIQDIGFGIPPDHTHRTSPPGRMEFDYPELFDTPGESERPEWANRVYDAYAATMQPLLVFIAGPQKRFTAKDHNYVAGEEVEKTIVAVWDGPGPTRIAAEWKLVSDNAVLAAGREEFDLRQGAVEGRTIRFQMPAVVEKINAELQLSVQPTDGRAATTTALETGRG